MWQQPHQLHDVDRFENGSGTKERPRMTRCRRGKLAEFDFQGYVEDRLVYDGLPLFSIAALPSVRERVILIRSFTKSFAILGVALLSVTVVPAQMRMGESWYRGTADSVFQNLHLIEEYRGDAVLVFGADHIYKMNIRQMTDFHFQKGAIATVACLPIKKEEAE
jgi:hypothetical protein